MKDFLERLFQRSSIFVIVAGAVLLLIGAASEINLGTFGIRIPDTTSRTVVMIIGAVVIAFGLLLVWRDISSPKAETDQALSCDEYGLQIVSPAVGAQVDHTFSVSGVFRKTPPNDYEIWVFTTYNDGQTKMYWPQEKAVIKRSTWHSQVNWLGGDDDGQTILVFLVGKQGQTLIHYFKTAGYINQKWVGITKFTDDIVECASTTVICKK